MKPDESSVEGRAWVSGAYDCHSKALRRYLMRRLRNDQDARELAQEVWARLLRVKNPSSIQEPLAYIYRAASNVLAEHHTKAKRSPVHFDTAAALDAAEAPLEMTEDGLAEDLSNRQYLQRILARLPPTSREVLLLRLCDGLSYGAIGRRLGLSATTSEKYFFRALAAVRQRNPKNAEADDLVGPSARAAPVGGAAQGGAMVVVVST